MIGIHQSIARRARQLLLLRYAAVIGGFFVLAGIGIAIGMHQATSDVVIETLPTKSVPESQDDYTGLYQNRTTSEPSAEAAPNAASEVPDPPANSVAPATPQSVRPSPSNTVNASPNVITTPGVPEPPVVPPSPEPPPETTPNPPTDTGTDT